MRKLCLTACVAIAMLLSSEKSEAQDLHSLIPGRTTRGSHKSSTLEEMQFVIGDDVYMTYVAATIDSAITGVECVSGSDGFYHGVIEGFLDIKIPVFDAAKAR